MTTAASSSSASTADLAVRPEELANAFFSVAHALKRTVNARFQHTGLSVARLRVLYTLATGGPVRMGELSQCVDVAARTMTSTVEAMERDGLVRRAPDPDDGRATVVHLTDDGRDAYEEGLRLQSSTVADIFEALDDDQRASLAALLDALASEAAPVGAAVAQRPGAEGAKSGDAASFDLSAAQPSRRPT